MYTRTDNTRNIIPSQSLPTSLPGPIGMVHGVSPDTHWPLYQNAGWRKFLPYDVPEGMVVVPDSRTTTDDGDTVVESYEVISVDQHEADNAQRQQTRVLGLVDAYGADVAIMGRLLAVFGLSFPCEPADAIALIKGGLATEHISLDLAPHAETLYARYKELQAVMTDNEMAAVADILRGVL
jgi:hypothetical protein